MPFCSEDGNLFGTIFRTQRHLQYLISNFALGVPLFLLRLLLLARFFLSVCLIQDFSVAPYPLVCLSIPELEVGFCLLAPHVLGSVPGVFVLAIYVALGICVALLRLGICLAIHSGAHI